MASFKKVMDRKRKKFLPGQATMDALSGHANKVAKAVRSSGRSQVAAATSMEVKETGKHSALKAGYFGSRQINRHNSARALKGTREQFRIDARIGMANQRQHDVFPIPALPWRGNSVFWELFPNGMPTGDVVPIVDVYTTPNGVQTNWETPAIQTTAFKKKISTNGTTNFTEIDIPNGAIKVIENRLRLCLDAGTGAKAVCMRVLVIKLPDCMIRNPTTGVPQFVALNGFKLKDFFGKEMPAEANAPFFGNITSFMRKTITQETEFLHGYKVLVDKTFTSSELSGAMDDRHFDFNFPHGEILEEEMDYIAATGNADIASLATTGTHLGNGRIIWGIYYEYPSVQIPFPVATLQSEHASNIAIWPHFFGDYKFKFRATS